MGRNCTAHVLRLICQERIVIGDRGVSNVDGLVHKTERVRFGTVSITHKVLKTYMEDSW